ncbi:UNVERIFIED_CONTAM: protein DETOXIFICATION 32 [Sesamum radiatum]|uniref:Protein DETOXIFICATION 32 n=1 Tax=Sesamum radiatum TaxID=300843 RepID=A0AAW2M3Y2_SESRA
MEGGVKEALLEKRHHQEKGGEGFIKEFGAESKTLWKLSGPAIFTSICQYSLGALTQTFAGQVGRSSSPPSPSRTQSLLGWLSAPCWEWEARWRRCAGRHTVQAGEDVGRIHAEVMGHTAGHRVRAAPALHLRSARPSLLRGVCRDFSGCRSICAVDDTTAVRVLFEFSNTEISCKQRQEDDAMAWISGIGSAWFSAGC